MFSIEFDARRVLVRAKMWGFLSIDEVAAFSRQEQQTAASMGWRSGEFLLLIDTVDAVIQSQEVVAAFMGIVINSPLKARRIAVVRGSSLTRMQTQRILTIREEAAIFSTLPEAEEWLFAVTDVSLTQATAALQATAHLGDQAPRNERVVRPI